MKRLECLKSKFNSNAVFKYIIWGAGVHGRRAYEIMNELFPKAVLVCFVDKYMTGTMMGTAIISSDALDNNFDYAIIATHPGRQEATNKMKSYNKKITEDYCYFISKDVPELSGDNE